MKKATIILLAAVFLVVGWIVWRANRQRAAETFVLPDGNRLVFRGATVGTNGQMHFGSLFERWMMRLPGKYGARGRVNSWTDDYPAEALVLWFTLDRMPPPQTYVEVQLGGQFRASRVGQYWLPPRALTNGQVITLSGLTVWPRRSKTITAEVFLDARGGRERLGTLTFPNPNFRAYPEWTPETLPAARQVGDTTFELMALVAHRPGHGVGPVFRVKRNGAPDADWEVCSYQTRDALGNWFESQPAPPAFTPRGPRAYGNSNGVIFAESAAWGAWPEEKAWKFGVEFVRSRRFESNEVYVLRGVPVRARAGRTTDTWSTNVAAGLIQLRHEPDWNKPNRLPRISTFELEQSDFSGATTNPLRVFLLEAVTDRGEKLVPFDQRRIDVPPDAKTVDITVAIPPRHFVEFLIDPATLGSTNPVPVWRD